MTIFKYWVLLPIACILLIELGLRWWWTNPYHLYAKPPTDFRLHEPGFVGYARVEDDIYPGTHSVRLEIDANRAIAPAPGVVRGAVIALGGSTTECGLVPEGQRWPELLQPAAYNFGVSGNCALDSYHNLAYLLARGNPKFDTVLLMHAVNDLDHYLTRGLSDFAQWIPEPIGNVLANADAADNRLFFSVRVKDSALLAFIRYHSNNLRGRNFYLALAKPADAQRGRPRIDKRDFSDLVAAVTAELLPARSKVLRQLAELCRQSAVELVLLTQPHAFGRNYHPPQHDLRVFPSYRKRPLNASQAAQIMDILNQQTKRLASELQLRLIDVDACFAAQTVDEFFFDSVHYTAEGSRQFAACVNRS